MARKKFLAKHTGAQLLDEAASCCVKAGILCIALERCVSIGTCVMLFNTQSILKGSMLSLLNQLSNLHSSTLYLQSIQKILKIHCEQEDKLEKFNNKFSQIEFRNVSFKYPNSNEYVLLDLSFILEKGKTYSIVGFNGSGKTTLIKLLLKLYEPTSGAIYIDGVDLQDIDAESYHRQISAVFQDFIRYPFSVAENIGVDKLSMSKDDMDKICKACELADADEFIKNLPNGYQTLLMKDWSSGVDISQGQWQKIAIARCFFRNSVISVLDEPFSSLDANAEYNIVQNLRHVRENRLNIFITHRFSSITLADEIIVIEGGKITEQGCHAELLQKNGTYAKLYNAQLNSLEQL